MQGSNCCPAEGKSYIHLHVIKENVLQYVIEIEDGVFLCRALHCAFKFLALAVDDDFVTLEYTWAVFGQSRDVYFVEVLAMPEERCILQVVTFDVHCLIKIWTKQIA